MSAPNPTADSGHMNALELKRIALRSEARRADSMARSTIDDAIMTDMGSEISQQDRPDLRGHQARSPVAARPDPPLRGMDKLVSDLLASQREVKDQRIAVSTLEAEVSRLQDEAASERQDHLAALDKIETVKQQTEKQASARFAEKEEEVSDLRRLLAFYKTNGEEVSSQFRDLQATCQGLEASLRAKDVALRESASLIKDLNVRLCDPSEGSVKTEEA